MAKDPAFLFYSQDFLTGVSDLTMEERGQYITLLCLQHQKGHLSKKIIDISVPGLSPDVLSKFTVDNFGLFFNKRLDEEKEKRRKHSEKQRDRAKKGWEKRNAMAYAAALPLEDENENEDVIVNESAIEERKTDTVSLRVQESEPINNLLSDQQWIEQFRMKNRAIKDWKMFFEYLRNKCAIEEIDHDTKKIVARANLLAMNWKNEKKEADKLISKQDQILNQILKNEEDRKTGAYTGSDEGQ